MSIAKSNRPRSSLNFILAPFLSSAPFRPRLGTLTFAFSDVNTILSTATPGLLSCTSRGVVPHFSIDHARITPSCTWLSLPFESFLDHRPPVPTLFPAERPLHEYLGFKPEKHILCLVLRDPSDIHPMPANAHDAVHATCVRGVQKVTPTAWADIVHKTRPDIITALTDTPFTPAPFSNKRIIKSVERSLTWLSALLRPLLSAPATSPNSEHHPTDKDATLGTATPDEPTHPLQILVPLAGSTNPQARTQFSQGLVETLHGPEAERIFPLPTLDSGVAGYTVDLAPLHTAFYAVAPTPLLSPPEEDVGPVSPGGLSISSQKPPPVPGPIPAVLSAPPIPHANLKELLQASLEVLPTSKPRIVHSARSPHEILRLVRDVGIDMFDTWLAQRAADVGVALDFVFPVPVTVNEGDGSATKLAGTHNLYESAYAHQFTRLADGLLDAHTAETISASDTSVGVCRCFACSPVPPTRVLSHSKLDPVPPPVGKQETIKPYTRGYIHHLLHTHEMSAHTLLASHNLAVLEAFMAGVRRVLGERGAEGFEEEVKIFEERYGEAEWGGVIREAEGMWRGVERARGKGRLARERERQAALLVAEAVEG